MRDSPVHVLEVAGGGAWLSAEQHDHRVSLGWDESKEEDVLAAAVVALQDGLAQGAILVQGDFLGLGSHQVVDDVAGHNREAKMHVNTGGGQK